MQRPWNTRLKLSHYPPGLVQGVHLFNRALIKVYLKSIILNMILHLSNPDIPKTNWFAWVPMIL